MPTTPQVNNPSAQKIPNIVSKQVKAVFKANNTCAGLIVGPKLVLDAEGYETKGFIASEEVYTLIDITKTTIRINKTAQQIKIEIVAALTLRILLSSILEKSVF